MMFNGLTVFLFVSVLGDFVSARGEVVYCFAL